MEHNQNTITKHQRVIQIKFHDHSWLFHQLLKKLTFVKRLFWQLGTCFSGHCCCREVTITERFKQEAMYGLSAGSKKVAISRGSTVLPIQIASLSMYNYYFTTYRKIPKISPGAYIFQRPFLRGLFLEGLIFGGAYIRRGLSTEGNLHFKWGRIFTIFALFYLVFEGKFQVQAPQGAYIWRGDLTEGFLHYDFGGLIFGGAYSWRGLFSEFYGMLRKFNPPWQQW